ncbi:hypothetical protein MMYC01_204037 [Madurella mycetomatis]|uniref:Uncharacterized protein n=1 Tax=Madurella mycetomatis TaxID=100816 RepID=A0A175W5B9_9PEZI|nr:hypothetical protein MMYC01_204037 [Madurella mycetomatis]
MSGFGLQPGPTITPARTGLDQTCRCLPTYSRHSACLFYPRRNTSTFQVPGSVSRRHPLGEPPEINRLLGRVIARFPGAGKRYGKKRQPIPIDARLNV